MNCSQCGKKIEEGSKFCEVCGCKITVTEDKEIIVNNNNVEKLENEILQEANENYKDDLKTEVKTEKELIENNPSIEDDAIIESDAIIKNNAIDTIIKDDSIVEYSNVREDEGIIEDNHIVEDSDFTEDNDFAEDDDFIENENSIEDEESEIVHKKSSMSIWKKVVIAIVSINIILLAGGVIYLRQINSPEKVIEKFILALSESNYEELVKVAVPRDSSISINENNSKALFKLYKNDSSVKKEIESELNEQLNSKKKSGNSQSDSMVSLIEENHILYKSYKIGIQDYTVNLSSNLNNTKVEGFDIPVEIPNIGEEVRLGKVLLGEYEVTGISVGGFEVEYKYKGTYDVVKDSRPVFVAFDFSTITIEKPSYPVSNIYINDKIYENLNFENGVLNISPIPSGALVKVECKAPWGSPLISTYQVSSGQSSYVNNFVPSFELDEATKSTIINVAGNFYSNMYSYFNERDIDSLSKLNYRNNIYVIDNFISTIKDYNSEKFYGYYTVNYTLDNLAADKKLVSEDLSSGKFEVYVEATVESVDTYYDKDGKIDTDKKSNGTNKYNQGYDFTIKNIDGNWVVTSVSQRFSREIEEIYNFN